MNIGIDIRALLEREYSGVSEYTYNLLKGLFRLDKNNRYKLFYNAARDMSGTIPGFSQENVEIVRTRYPNKFFNNILQRLLKWPKIDSLLGGVDIFFAPNIGYISLAEACRKILVIHDLSYLRYPEFYSLKRRAWHAIMNTKSMISRFDRIIAVSENTKRDLIELLAVEPKKIEMIYSGISGNFRVIESGHEDLSRIKRKYSLPDNFILFLGTMEPRKNIEGVIRAYERYCGMPGAERISLVIAGASGWKNTAVFKEANVGQAGGRIKFIGYVDGRDKVFLYNLASLFIFPSFYEGFGFPPLEAMASGVPVITSDTSSLPEVAGAAAITVNPLDIRGIAEAINSILSDERLRNGLIEKGLMRSREFSWAKTAEKYLDIFLEKTIDKPDAF